MNRWGNIIGSSCRGILFLVESCEKWSLVENFPWNKEIFIARVRDTHNTVAPRCRRCSRIKNCIFDAFLGTDRRTSIFNRLIARKKYQNLVLLGSDSINRSNNIISSRCSRFILLKCRLIMHYLDRLTSKRPI